MLALEALGWDASFQHSLDQLEQSSLIPARVASVDRGRFHLLGLDAPVWASCLPRLARARDPLALPTVGDWVAVGHATGEPMIEALLPRASRLVRRAAGEAAAPQLVAANIDRTLIVSAIGRELNPRRLERYLAAVWDGNAEPVIVVNKVDLPHDRAALADALRGSAPDVTIVWLSASSGEGVAELEALLPPGRTAALVGSSGVGKSTLLNRLLRSDVQQTGAVRAHDDRGRHTTTRRDLLIAPSGALIIDTPGMRELGLWNAERGVAAVFDDVQRLVAACRFRDCGHADEPGCAVNAAVAEGALARERLDAYRRLVAELADTRQRAVAAPNAKRRGRTESRAARSFRRGRPKDD